MKTTKTLPQIAGEFRRKNGNKVKDFTTGRMFQFSAKEVKNEVIRQSDISIRRTREQFEISVKGFCRKLIRKKLQLFAESLPSDGLSMGSTYYVHASFFKSQAINPFYKRTEEISNSVWIDGKSDRTSEYRGGRYSATHYTHAIKLSLSEIAKASLIGGLITIKGERIDNHIIKCEWFEAKGYKSNYNISRVSGFLTQDFHAKSVDQAVEWRKNKAKQLLEKRKSLLKVKAFELAKERAKNMFYGLQHSLEVGNCEAGTFAFIAKRELEKEWGYRGDFLLRIANGQTHYVQKMIEKRALQILNS